MPTAYIAAWRARWQAIKATATYNEGFGLERTWRDNADAWGPPLETTEQSVSLPDGRTLKGRTFLHVGMVVWDPANGAEVIGWPEASSA